MPVVIDVRRYEAIVTTYRMKDEGDVWSYQLYGEERIDSGRTSSGRNPAINLYLYIDVYICFAILTSQVRCYCILYLLSLIVTMYWTKFLYELYRVLVFIILRVTFSFYFLCQ